MTDENKHIDQLIQDKLLGYEEQPPAHIWAAVRPSAAMLWVKRGVVGAFILAATAVAYWLFTDTDDVEMAVRQQQTAVEHNVPPAEAQTLTSAIDINNEDNTPIGQFQNSEHISPALSVEQPQAATVAEYKSDAQHRRLVEANNSINANATTEATTAVAYQQNKQATDIPDLITQAVAVFETETVSNRMLISGLTPLSVRGLAVKRDLSLPLVATLYALQAGKDFKETASNAKIAANSNNWAFGVELSPEWTRLQESKTTITSYGIDFSVRKYFNNFYLASGVGLSYSTDNGKYQVDYKKSEYKGSYQYVDSVSFEVNDDNVTPIYHTTRIDVYDTIDKVRISENKNKYLYINIPLYMGFEYSLGKRWQTDLYAGLRSGILVYKNIPDPKLEDNVFLVKSTYNDRKDFYLQGQIGVGLHYQLHKHWYLGLSPNMSYYFTSPIGNETKKPYALGLRFGIRYKWHR